jgi:hypothetical protein
MVFFSTTEEENIAYFLEKKKLMTQLASLVIMAHEGIGRAQLANSNKKTSEEAHELQARRAFPVAAPVSGSGYNTD